jgi:hypothetical protein
MSDRLTIALLPAKFALGPTRSGRDPDRAFEVNLAAGMLVHRMADPAVVSPDGCSFPAKWTLRATGDGKPMNIEFFARITDATSRSEVLRDGLLARGWNPRNG